MALGYPWRAGFRRSGAPGDGLNTQRARSELLPRCARLAGPVGFAGRRGRATTGHTSTRVRRIRGVVGLRLWPRAQRTSPLASASFGGLVLLGHAGRDAPALTDRDAVVLGPGPDIGAAMTAGRR